MKQDGKLALGTEDPDNLEVLKKPYQVGVPHPPGQARSNKDHRNLLHLVPEKQREEGLEEQSYRSGCTHSTQPLLQIKDSIT